MLCTALHCSWPDNFCRNASQLCVTPVGAFFSPADEFGDPGVIYMFSIQQSGCGSLALKAHKQEFTIGLNTSKETEWWLRIYFWASFLPLSSSFFQSGRNKKASWQAWGSDTLRLQLQAPSNYFFNSWVWELLLQPCCILRAVSGLLVAACVGCRNLGLVLLKSEVGATNRGSQASPLATEVRLFSFMSTTFTFFLTRQIDWCACAAPEHICPVPSHSCVSLHQPAGTVSL